MAASSTSFPECCRYCPYRAAVSGTCDHERRQSLVQTFIEDGEDSTCPIYDDWRATEMGRLSDRLENGTDLGQ